MITIPEQEQHEAEHVTVEPQKLDIKRIPRDFEAVLYYAALVKAATWVLKRLEEVPHEDMREIARAIVGK